jgi:guanylate kinase
MGLGKAFVLSAPSGAGKSSLISPLLGRFPNRLVYSVSATTRKPRSGEKDGVHYFFLDLEKFQAMRARGELAEYNEVHGNFYGTPRAPLDAALDQGLGVVLDLDVYGKVNFDKAYPDAVGILVIPPDFDELERRLRLRGTDSEEIIALRLKNARDEVAFARSRGKYEYSVVNDDFDRAFAELVRIFEKELGGGGGDMGGPPGAPRAPPPPPPKNKGAPGKRGVRKRGPPIYERGARESQKPHTPKK